MNNPNNKSIESPNPEQSANRDEYFEQLYSLFARYIQCGTKEEEEELKEKILGISLIKKTMRKPDRLKIYKSALKKFRDEPSFLCVLLKDHYRSFIGDDTWLDDFKVVTMFPEFGSFMPRRSNFGEPWWRHHPTSDKGKSIRIRTLKKCIIKSTPKQ